MRLALRLAFARVPWRAPFETAEHWARLRGGNKMLFYHPDDRVIGRAAALHTALERRGRLDGTHVIRLGGQPEDAHNDDPDDYAPVEWEAALAWMRQALHLAEPVSQQPERLHVRARRRVGGTRGDSGEGRGGMGKDGSEDSPCVRSLE